MTYEPNQHQQPPAANPSGPWTPTPASSNLYNPVNYSTAAPNNPLAVWSLVTSIVGTLLLWFIGPIGGIIMGHISLKQIKTTGDGGRGMALAGVIIGYAGLFLQIAVVVLSFLLIGWAATEISTYGY